MQQLLEIVLAGRASSNFQVRVEYSFISTDTKMALCIFHNPIMKKFYTVKWIVVPAQREKFTHHHSMQLELSEGSTKQKRNSKGTQTRRFEQVEKSKPHTIGPKHFRSSFQNLFSLLSDSHQTFIIKSSDSVQTVVRRSSNIHQTVIKLSSNSHQTVKIFIFFSL